MKRRMSAIATDFLHSFSCDVTGQELPQRFNNPFSYRPHALCVLAAGEVRSYIGRSEQLKAEVAEGKMFGVLVVRTPQGRVGYLMAFSGLLGGSSMQPGFVPPVFDFLSPNGYFKQEEGRISQLNRRIAALEHESRNSAAALELASLKHEMESELAAMREQMRESKLRRDALRAGGALDSGGEAALVRESQFQKAELKRIAAAWKERIAKCEAAAVPLEKEIAQLKDERKRASAALQEWLFTNFRVLNAEGGEKDLLMIFKEFRGVLPPAGAGECAAPKLLQYAYTNGYKPLCMAEFWMGASPAGEVRRDGCFYGSCKSKCEPILDFMLRGIDVEPMNILQHPGGREIKVIYEDEYIIAVDKPWGMLSAPGIVGGESVQEYLCRIRGNNDIVAVHRLDMATSGVLVAAKGSEALKRMQQLFAGRKVGKEYIALLDGVPREQCGEIALPLSADYTNRPLQIVDCANGKEAVTRFRVIETVASAGRERSLVSFVPVTGRTHQLRVHAASSMGLDTPIVGDELYGTAAERLMLHALKVEFEHPFTHCRINIHAALPEEFRGQCKT